MEQISLYEIIKTINQIAMDAKDFAPPDNKKIGLKREELFTEKKEKKIQDRRIIDGFFVNFARNNVRVTYSSDANLEEINRNKEDFEETVMTMIENIVSFIKKEFKEKTGKTLSLKRVQDKPFVEVNIQGSMVTQDIRYKGFLDYTITNKTNDEPADYFAKFAKNDKKVIKEAKEEIGKAFKKKMKNI